MNEGAQMLSTQQSFRGGMDAFTPAIGLREDQSALCENCLVDAGFSLRSRPGLQVLGGTTQNVVRANVGGLACFDTEAMEALLYIANGSVWEFSGRTGSLRWALKSALAGSPPSGFPAAGARIVAAQGISKLLLSDGVNHCAIWDGEADTWADAGSATTDTGSAPVGAKILLWHGFGAGSAVAGAAAGTWRMFASGQDANPDTIWVSDVLDFGPTAWDHLAWSFRVGGGEGQRITALAALPAAALLVGKSASIYLVSTPAAATSAADYSITPLSQSVGIVNARAVTTLGDTVLMVCSDGAIRGVGRMAAATGQFELGEPLSQPMQPYIDRINWEAAAEICAVTYKQWAFFGLPLDENERVSHVLVYSGRTGSWCGVWTGWEVRDWLVTRFGDQPALQVASTRVASLVVGAPIAVVGQWNELADRLDPETFEDLEAPITVRWRSRVPALGPAEEDKDLAWIRLRVRESAAGMTVRVFMDDELQRTFTLAAGYAPPQFSSVYSLNPRLPFLLPEAGVRDLARGLNHLKHGREPQIEIEATGANLELSGVTLAALPGIVRGA